VAASNLDCNLLLNAVFLTSCAQAHGVFNHSVFTVLYHVLVAG